MAKIKEKCSTACWDKPKRIQLNVPAGVVEDNQQMRCRVKAKPALMAGPYGDLYVVFQVEEKVMFSLSEGLKSSTSYLSAF